MNFSLFQFALAVGLILGLYPYIAQSSRVEGRSQSVLVVGSVNADIVVPVEQFPSPGETLVTLDAEDGGRTIAGGKGANQAVSCSRLGVPTTMLCQFGNDANGSMLKKVLEQNGVDVSHSKRSSRPSGLGLVFLKKSGEVSSIVVGGANTNWPTEFSTGNLLNPDTNDIACVMLQMEIPQHVNELIAKAANAAGIPVFQDVGGENRVLDSDYLKLCMYLSPNLSELQRLTNMSVSTEDNILSAVRTLQGRGARNVLVTMGSAGSLLVTEKGEVLRVPCCQAEQVVDETGAGDNYRAAFVVAHFVDGKPLQESMRFASASGAVAVSRMGAIPACASRAECVAALKRSAAVAAVNKDLQHKIHNIKGGATVVQYRDSISDDSNHKKTTKKSEQLLRNIGISYTVRSRLLGISGGSTTDIDNDHSKEKSFPFKFASRLNSMKDRADLWSGGACTTTAEWIARQGTINGLDLVDFNYPQHFDGPVTDKERTKILAALQAANLDCGAICLRYPKEMQLGALTHPNRAIRAKAIQLTKEACEWTLALGGANEVVVWSAFDGYDYSLQVDYHDLWDDIVSAFQEICDAYPTVKVSLEFKPTDENTRYFAVSSTGSSIQLVKDVNRDNFGLTIDFGHCLMAGENPAQSVALVSGRPMSTKNGDEKQQKQRFINRLFGVQLGDGYGRLGAEDGLMFGSIHSLAALEFVLWLIKTNYKGHIYFDTFPRNEDPVRECEYNIRQFKKMHRLAQRLLNLHEDSRSSVDVAILNDKNHSDSDYNNGNDTNNNPSSSFHDSKNISRLATLMKNHDAMGVMELLESLENQKDGCSDSL